MYNIIYDFFLISCLGATSPNVKERKKKCVSEQYVRERKSNANKQFAYNKLKNEKHGSVRNEQQKSAPPQRPPQPKITNNEKEGMLIDLSPPSHIEINAIVPNGSPTLTSNMSASSILDAPIDIPTEDASNAAVDADDSTNISNEVNKLEPPPYQSPPTYMNTYGLTQQQSVFSSSTNFRDFNGTIGKAKAADPFDTSHIGADANPIYVNHSASNAMTTGIITKAENSTVFPTDPTRLSNKNLNNKSNYPYGMIPDHSVSKQSLPNSHFDDLVQNTMATMNTKSNHTNQIYSNGIIKNSNLSQRSNHSDMSSTSQNDLFPDQLNATLDTSDNNRSTEQLTGNNDSLSDSMKVNLSSLTINDVDEDHTSKNSSNNAVVIKKFDKTFLAELEKEIYKNDASASSLIVNTSKTYANQSSGKENSVSAIPNDIYVRNSTATLNRLHNDTLSTSSSASASTTPTKYHNANKSTNQDFASMKLNYASSPTNSRHYSSSQSLGASHPTQLSKKLNFDSQSGDSETTSMLNQIWMDRQLQKNPPANDSSGAATVSSIYSNNVSNATQNPYGIVGLEKNHSFVAVSNRPAVGQNAARASAYNAVPSDVYGSVTGSNVYDIVANSAAGSAYYGMIPGSGGTDYYEAILPNESVIYDEVAGDELLRPHRPAPLAPPVLSAQQIQRRMERAQKQLYGNVSTAGGSTMSIYGSVSGNDNSMAGAESNQKKVYALIQEVGADGEATELEATQALQAVNWDHSLAVRHFKVERLLK